MNLSVPKNVESDERVGKVVSGEGMVAFIGGG